MFEDSCSVAQQVFSRREKDSHEPVLAGGFQNYPSPGHHIAQSMVPWIGCDAKV